MTKVTLPPGLVMWPAGTARRNRLCVLISDIHCTDCTVGNQTASENDWQLFFDEMEFAVCNPGDKADTPAEQHIDELLLVLNGDIVDQQRAAVFRVLLLDARVPRQAAQARCHCDRRADCRQP